jgi:hypothetical protein
MKQTARYRNVTQPGTGVSAYAKYSIENTSKKLPEGEYQLSANGESIAVGVADWGPLAAGLWWTALVLVALGLVCFIGGSIYLAYALARIPAVGYCYNRIIRVP